MAIPETARTNKNGEATTTRLSDGSVKREVKPGTTVSGGRVTKPIEVILFAPPTFRACRPGSGVFFR